MSQILLQPAYFAPIAQYAAIVKNAEIVFEILDNFQKQTYRNRCYIYGANGKLLLNVPVIHNKNQRQLTTDVQVSYAEDWQKLHFKSLQSAYRSSPYFEYYEDDLATIFEKKTTFLKDLHQQTHNFVMDALQENRPTTFTEEYFRNPNNQIDARDLINCKGNSAILTNTTFESYTQMFDDKYGFIPNLSILDILFMEGPNAITYLEKINLNVSDNPITL